MRIIDVTQADLTCFKSILGTKQTANFPPLIGNMAYYAIKFNGGDNFEKRVQKVVGR